MNSETDWMANRCTDPSAIDSFAPDGGTGPGFCVRPSPQPGTQTTEGHGIVGHISEEVLWWLDKGADAAETGIDSLKFSVEKGGRIVGNLAFKAGHFEEEGLKVIKNTAGNLRGVVASAKWRKFFDKKIFNTRIFDADTIKGLEKTGKLLSKGALVVSIAEELNKAGDEFKNIWNSGGDLNDKLTRSFMVADVAALKGVASTVTTGAHYGLQVTAWGADQLGYSEAASMSRNWDSGMKTILEKKIDGEYITASIQDAVDNTVLGQKAVTWMMFTLDAIHSLHTSLLR